MLLSEHSSPKEWHLLVVEENLSIVNRLKEILRPYGIIVDQTTGRNFNLPVLNAFDPDIVFYHNRKCESPLVSLGEELINHFKDQFIQLVIYCQEVDLGDRISGIEAGITGFVKLPFDPDEVILAVKSRIETRALFLQLAQKQEQLDREVQERHQISEKLQEALNRVQFHYDNSPFAVIEFDPEYRIIRWSDEAQNIFGWCQKEVLGKKIQELKWVYESDVEVVENLSDDMSRGTRTRNINRNRNYTKDGRIIICDWYNSALNDRDGKLISVLSHVLDVTQRIEIEKARIDSENKLKLFFTQSLDGFFFMMLDEPVTWTDHSNKDEILDYVFAHQRITRVNQAMLDQYGYSEKDFLGLTPNDLFGHDVPAGKKVWKEFFDKGQLHIFTDVRKMDGTPMWVEGDYVCLYDDHGRITGHFGIQRDISERRSNEEKILEIDQTLKDVMDFAQIGYWSWDIKSGQVTWSDGMFKIFGVNKEDFHGDLNQVIQDVIHPEDRDLVLHSNRLVEEQGKPVPLEYRVIWNDGSIHWIWAEAGEPLKDPKGEPLKLVGFAQEITRRKEMEDKFLQMSKVIEQSPVSIIITDHLGLIEYVNPKFSEITGYLPDEVIGKNPRILKSGEKSKNEYKQLWDLISSGKEWRGEFHNRKKDGSLYWESASISALKDDKGRITHYFAIKEDITEDKILLEELKIAQKQAIAGDKLKTAFINNMSHEIRTPINSIVGFTELLDDPDYSDSEKNRFKELIKSGSQHLLNVITDIVQISAIDSGLMSSNVEDFFIDIELYGLYTQFYPLARKKGLELVLITGNVHESCKFSTDKTKLIQILTNLITNAIKFTEKGEIRIGCRKIANGLEISVTDTGIGIAPDKLQIIFDRFRQADDSISRKYGGSGLGLAIAKAYSETIGAKLLVESIPGVGSKFWLLFPLIPTNVT